MEISIWAHNLPKAMFDTPKVKKFSIPVVSAKYRWFPLYGVSQTYRLMTLLAGARCEAAPSLYVTLMREE